MDCTEFLRIHIHVAERITQHRFDFFIYMTRSDVSICNSVNFIIKTIEICFKSLAFWVKFIYTDATMFTHEVE